MPTPANFTKDELPVVALVGRVNVGKSTLFNKLIEEQKAIVSNVPGTTRTSNEGLVLWRGENFRLIDTGGLTFQDDVPLESDILAQSEAAMKQADIIVFVTDAKDGILPQERELAKRLRRLIEKKIILVANKVDSKSIAMNLGDPSWSKLGLGEPFPISAANGRNVGDFLDHLHNLFGEIEKPPSSVTKYTEEMMYVSIVGKPNVGKSSLFNKIIGEDKVIVSDMEHTTREPHDTLVTYEHKIGDKITHQPITFVDTAGIRRKANVKGMLERAGIGKTIQTIEQSDIVLLVLDGSKPISSQDKQLAGLVEKRSKSVIILLNKWDLAEDNSAANRKQVEALIRYEFPHISFAPILFVSGKTGYRIHQLFPMLMHVWRARHTHIANRGLETFLEQVSKRHLPSRGKGTRHPKLMGMRQINTAPPIFELFIKYRTSLHRSYVSFIENRLREQFDFTGTPIVIKLTKMKR